MRKLSVIVPIYNTEQYLYQCLDSIVRQTYQNLEIICVDDGSTDRSGEILDEFAAKDSRIVSIHEQNMGESHARNVGILRSTGDYIAFVDCDDWLEEDTYQVLVELLEENDTDLAAVSWIKEFSDHSIQMTNNLLVKEGTISQEQLMSYVYRRDDYQGFAYMWDKLYRRKLIFRENGEVLLFSEKLRLGGDVLYLAEILLEARNGIYFDKACYHYRQRNASGCHTTDLAKRLDWLEGYKIVIKKYERQEVSDDIIIWVKRFLAYHSSNVAEMAYSQNNFEVLHFCQEIMKLYAKEYRDTNSGYLERIERYNRILQLS